MRRAGHTRAAWRAFCKLEFTGNILVVETNLDNRSVAGSGRELNEREPMVIVAKCACGKGLKLNETYAGKQVKRPGCSQILRAPIPANLGCFDSGWGCIVWS